MIMRKQNFKANPTPSLPLIHRSSRQIAKFKPEIHIIHIFPPEIIKTDIANFRDLVQRLTGKPVNANHQHRKVDPPGNMTILHNKPSVIKPKLEPLDGLNSNAFHHEDYFSPFSDIDSFIQDINELPLLPVDPSLHIQSSVEAGQLPWE